MSQDPDTTSGADARAAELREELAITDRRRAEEEEAKAEEAVVEAQKDEATKERERHEAEVRAADAAAEAERARADAARAPASEPAPAIPPPADAADEGPERPELHVAAAFAGAFLFARVLKKIAE